MKGMDKQHFGSRPFVRLMDEERERWKKEMGVGQNPTSDKWIQVRWGVGIGVE